MAGGVPSDGGSLPVQNLQDHAFDTLNFKRTFTHYVLDGTDATGYNNTTGVFDEGWSYIPYDALRNSITPRDFLAIKAKYSKFRIRSFNFKVFRFWPLADSTRTVAAYTTIYTTIAQRVSLHFYKDSNHMLPDPTLLGSTSYVGLYDVNQAFRTPLVLGDEGQTTARLKRCQWQTAQNMAANEAGITAFTNMSIYNSGDVTYIEPGLDHSDGWTASGDDLKRWYNLGSATIDGVVSGDPIQTTQSRYLVEAETQSGTNWSYRNPPKHCYLRVDPIYGGDDTPINLTGKICIEYSCSIDVAGQSFFSSMAWGPSTLGQATSSGNAQAQGPAINAVNSKNLFQYNQAAVVDPPFGNDDPYRIYQQTETGEFGRVRRLDGSPPHKLQRTETSTSAAQSADNVRDV